MLQMLPSLDPVLDADWYYTQQDMRAERIANSHYCRDCVHCDISPSNDSEGYCRIELEWCEPDTLISELGCENWEVPNA